MVNCRVEISGQFSKGIQSLCKSNAMIRERMKGNRQDGVRDLLYTPGRENDIFCKVMTSRYSFISLNRRVQLYVNTLYGELELNW